MTDQFRRDMVRAWKSGMSFAAFHLGIAYSNGWGVSQNPKRAFRWFKLAANAKIQPAYYHLAMCYYSGEGTKRNLSLAYKWFEAAAASRDWDAEYMLAQNMIDGAGTEKNLVRGMKQMKRLAKLHGEAAVYLCDHFLRRRRFSIAEKYAKLATTLGDPDAPLWADLVNQSIAAFRR